MANSPGQPRKLLPEAAYTKALSSVVQREYFPDLPKLEHQLALLERRSEGDVPGAVEVRRATRRLLEEEENRIVDEQDLTQNAVRRTARPLHQESVTGFHTRVTNEEVDKFDATQKKEIQAQRRKMEGLLLPHNSRGQALRLASSSTSGNDLPPIMNGLFFPLAPLQRAPQTGTTSQDSTTSSVDRQGFSNSSSLALMPPPPTRTTQSQFSSIPKRQLVEYTPRQDHEKNIQPEQTRFPNQHLQIIPQPSRGLFPSSSASSATSDTDGSLTDASTDLDAPLRPIDIERQRRSQQRRRQQEAYVSMTPVIVPGAGNESPIMTWGTVDAPPVVLFDGESIASSTVQSVTSSMVESVTSSEFSFAGESTRDRAARKAENRLMRRAKRAKASQASTKASRAGSLTPAAKALYKKFKRSASRSRDGFASSLRSSYKPKRRSSRRSAKQSNETKIVP